MLQRWRTILISIVDTLMSHCWGKFSEESHITLVGYPWWVCVSFYCCHSLDSCAHTYPRKFLMQFLTFIPNSFMERYYYKSSAWCRRPTYINKFINAQSTHFQHNLRYITHREFKMDICGKCFPGKRAFKLKGQMFLVWNPIFTTTIRAYNEQSLALFNYEITSLLGIRCIWIIHGNYFGD